MPIVSFSTEVAADMKILATLPPASLGDFSKVAVGNIRTGSVNKKAYAKAAEALSVDVATVANAIATISQIFLECSRRKANAADFELSVGAEANLSDEAKTAMSGVYEAHTKAIREELSSMDMSLPHYHNLDWRLDLQLASRCRRNNVKPSFVLELQTTNSDGSEAESVMQCDFANMKHMLDELEIALGESKSKHCARIIRYVK